MSRRKIERADWAGPGSGDAPELRLGNRLIVFQEFEPVGPCISINLSGEEKAIVVRAGNFDKFFRLICRIVESQTELEWNNLVVAAVYNHNGAADASDVING